MAGAKESGTGTSLATRAAPARAPGARAADQALAPLAEGDAVRILLVGDTGCGKTVAARYIVPEYLKRSPGMVAVIDDKLPDRSRFEGQLRRDVDDLRNRPADPEPRVIVFRGEPARRIWVDQEEVDDWQWEMALRRHKTLAVHDELRRACHYGQWKAGKLSTISQSYHEGRDLGISKLACVRLLQEIPIEVVDESDAIMCWKVDGTALAKLEERRRAEGEVIEVIRALPGIETPKAERGDFVLLMRGRPWDRTIYRFEET